MDDFIFGGGQTKELEVALRRGNWTSPEIDKLCEGNLLEKVREVVIGRAEIRPMKYIINCDALPLCPEGYKVECHKKSGQMEWTPNCVDLLLTDNQKNSEPYLGHALQKGLTDKPVLNACVLDWLLTKTDLIPKEWKNKYIFFWGTIYRAYNDELYVRCLHWDLNKWRWSFLWFNNAFNDYCPTALSASA